MFSFLSSAHPSSLADDNAAAVTNKHYVNGNPILPPFDSHLETALFGLGCFWGAERKFWQQDGVFTTAVGYAGGSAKNPTYEDVCSGLSEHAEVVLVVFEPARTTYSALLSLFWESHDPTQGMRQGNDHGSQYRSVIYTFGDTQFALAMESKTSYQEMLKQADYGNITTEITSAAEFYYAEEYHQQYLAKNSAGYCGLAGTGIMTSTTAE